MMPTHINRSKNLLKDGEEYAKKGGFIDLTTSSDPKHLEPDEVRASEALACLLNNGVKINQITFFFQTEMEACLYLMIEES